MQQNLAKLITLILLGILCQMFFVSCKNKQNEHDAGLKIFRYNEASGINSLDPAYAKDLPHIWACNQLYNGLVSMDKQLNVVPSIAKSWLVSTDGLTYTFHLRNDVFFHTHPLFPNGNRKVVANDFYFSFNRLMKRETASPGSWIFNAVAIDSGLYSFIVLNDSTFQIKLSSAFPPFIELLTMTYASVVPQEIVEYYGTDFRKNPVGSGPFRFQYWKEGVKLVLRKNEHYFETNSGIRLPLLDAVSISFLNDKQTAFMEFAKGELDFMSGIDARYKDEILTRDGMLKAKYTNRIKLYKEPFLNTEYLGILVDPENPRSLTDKWLRQAINYSIDRKKLIRFLRNGIGIPGHSGIIPSGLKGYDSLSSIGYEYNPEKARQLMEQYGPLKKKITLTTTADYVDVCKYIQAQLAETGISIELEISPAATMREMRAKSELSFFRASWVADYPDAENYLSLFYSKNKSPDGPNYTHFNNKVFDSIYLHTMSIYDINERKGLYKMLDSIVMEDAPVVVLYYDEVLRFVNQRVINLGSNPINLLDLRTADIKLN